MIFLAMQLIYRLQHLFLAIIIVQVVQANKLLHSVGQVRGLSTPYGVLAIQTQLISLADNQIEVFSGACNSLTPIAGGCNDNPVSGFDVAAELQLNALTPGSVVYIRVDGVDNLTGTFNIMASDSIAQAGFNNQDCLGAIPVCGNQVIH